MKQMRVPTDKNLGFLCRMGWHTFSAWGPIEVEDYFSTTRVGLVRRWVQYRVCRSCNMLDRRVVAIEALDGECDAAVT
jgi:hypothetical protein